VKTKDTEISSVQQAITEAFPLGDGDCAGNQEAHHAFDVELRQLAEEIVAFYPSLTQLLLSLSDEASTTLVGRKRGDHARHQPSPDEIDEQPIDCQQLSRREFFVAGDSLGKPSDVILKISNEMGASRRAATSDDL